MIISVNNFELLRCRFHFIDRENIVTGSDIGSQIFYFYFRFQHGGKNHARPRTCYSNCFGTLIKNYFVPNFIVYWYTLCYPVVYNSWKLQRCEKTKMTTEIDDLPLSLCVRSQVRLFADDCLLYRSVKTQQDQQQLQTDLHSLERWGDAF